MNIDYLLLLRNIFDGEKEGELCIIDGKNKRNLYFKKGILVFASSTKEEEKLLNVIYELNYMGKKRYKSLMKYLNNNEKEKLKLGQKLVFDKVISPMQLYYAIKVQTEKIAVDIAKIKKIEMEFKEKEIQKTNTAYIEISPIEIILKSIESYKIDKKELGKIFKGSLVKTRYSRKYEHILSKRERYILEAMNDFYSFKSMIKTVKKNDTEFFIRFLLKAYIFEFIVFENTNKLKYKLNSKKLVNTYENSKNTMLAEILKEKKDNTHDRQSKNNSESFINSLTNSPSNKDNNREENDVSDFEQIYKIAEKLYKNKKYKEVIKIIKNIPDYRKLTSKIILLLAKAEARVDIHKTEAEKILLEFIRSKPWIKEGFYELLLLYKEENLSKRAKPIIKKALKYFPDDEEFLYFKEFFLKPKKINFFK